jgi:hypothetical protein
MQAGSMRKSEKAKKRRGIWKSLTRGWFSLTVLISSRHGSTELEIAEDAQELENHTFPLLDSWNLYRHSNLGENYVFSLLKFQLWTSVTLFLR